MHARDSLGRLEAWLKAHHPRDVLMPLAAEPVGVGAAPSKGGKQPYARHRGGMWGWSQWDRELKRCPAGSVPEVGVLLRTLCALDFDDVETADRFEAEHPELRRAPRETRAATPRTAADGSGMRVSTLGPSSRFWRIWESLRAKSYTRNSSERASVLASPAKCERPSQLLTSFRLEGAAPLKPSPSLSHGPADELSPRSHERGPVEAGSSPNLLLDAQPSPRSHERGPVEAAE